MTNDLPLINVTLRDEEGKKVTTYDSYLAEKKRADELEIKLESALQRIQELEQKLGVQLNLIPKLTKEKAEQLLEVFNDYCRELAAND